MKINISKRIAIFMLALCASVFVLTACGGDGFDAYMQGEPNLRSTIDSEMSILSEDAEGSVQYTENSAKVTVDYYALTQAEVEGTESEKITKRCEAILQEAFDQYHEDTGKTATMEITIYGHDAVKQ